jgi:RNA polymerase sigma-70 factor (ECF subfamily)
MDDQELIIKARTGDLDAFSELVKRYQGNVRACLAVRLYLKHEAEDLAQEAFVVAFRKLDEFDTEQPFGPWIRTIAFNLLRNHWRKHRPVPMGGAEELESLRAEVIGLRYWDKNESDTLAALKLCIEKLDEPMRNLLTLRYHEGLSVGNLTKKMNVNHSTMTMRLHRMRDQLRLCIKQVAGSPGYE